MILDYRVTRTGGKIDVAFFWQDDVTEKDFLAEFLDVAVNSLEKFRRCYSVGDIVEGSFFGGATDEIGGIMEYDAVGGYRVHGAFGANEE